MNCSPSSLMYGARCQRCLPRGAVPILTTWLLCQFANRPRRACLAQATAYTDDYQRRVVLNGGTAVGTQSYNAIRDFLCTLIENGLDTQAIGFCCMAPDNFIAAATPVLASPLTGFDPWKYSTSAGLPVAPAAIPSWFTLDPTGLKNQSTPTPANFGIMQTGMIVGILPGGNYTLAVQVVSMNTASAAYTMGARGLAGNVVEHSLIHKFNANRRFACYSGAADLSEAIGVAPDQAACFLCGTRRSTTDWAWYQGLNGGFRQISSSNTNPGAKPAVDHWLFCLNDNSVVSGRMLPGTISFAGMFTGLTSAQIQVLYNAINVMRNAMGGGAI